MLQCDLTEGVVHKDKSLSSQDKRKYSLLWERSRHFQSTISSNLFLKLDSGDGYTNDLLKITGHSQYVGFMVCSFISVNLLNFLKKRSNKL